MSMRAQDVDAQGFGRVMRGYNPQQVDDLLERVRAALTEAGGQQARLREENQQLQGELGQVRQQLDRVSHQLNVYQEMEETIKQTMLMAQRTREEIYSGARAKSSDFGRRPAGGPAHPGAGRPGGRGHQGPGRVPARGLRRLSRAGARDAAQTAGAGHPPAPEPMPGQCPTRGGSRRGC